MASESVPFSDEFAQTAREEAARLAARAQEVRARGERWLERAGDLLREADRLEHRVRELDEVLGWAPQLRLDLQSRVLQGQRLREEATRILLERRGLRVAVHYREWFALITEEGMTVAGKDPLATFLTQVTRSPVVIRVDEGKGVYELDPHGAYERARARLQEALAEQASSGDGVARLDAARRELDAVLEARTQLLRGQIRRETETLRTG
jgi:hypothetical protein